MFETMISKECIVVVAFATSVMDGGASTANYFGKFVGETEDCIILDVSQIKCDSVIGNINKNIVGKTYINKKYIVAINVK